jgi:hypothetical protein
MLSLLSILAFTVPARSMPFAWLRQSSDKGICDPLPHGHPSQAAHRPLAAPPPVVIAQMFEWTWDSVAAECIDFLGPAGYGFVQGESLPPLLAFSSLTV